MWLMNLWGVLQAFFTWILFIEREELGRRPKMSLVAAEYSMTFVSIPRPLTNASECQRVRLAVSSWLASDWTTKVIMFINRREFCPEIKLADELDQLWGLGRVNYAGSTRCDPSGIPYINAWFQDGTRLSTTKYVSMINSDIILSSKWWRYCTDLMNQYSRRLKPLLCSPRMNVNFTLTALTKVRFCERFLLRDIDRLMKKLGPEPNRGGGVDIFTFLRSKPPIDLSRIPPFLMGRPVWDCWILGWSSRFCQTISTNFTPPIFHLNHESRNRDPKDPTVSYNERLGKRTGRFFAGASRVNLIARGGRIFVNEF
jgi:hypothetical protein